MRIPLGKENTIIPGPTSLCTSKEKKGKKQKPERALGAATSYVPDVDIDRKLRVYSEKTKRSFNNSIDYLLHLQFEAMEKEKTNDSSNKKVS